MQPTTESEANRAIAVEPPIETRAAWRVRRLRVVEHGVLEVEFVDGVQGVVDLRSRLARTDIIGTAWEPLRDKAFFARASIVLGAVTWPGDVDIAPDAMYDQIRAHGQWVVS